MVRRDILSALFILLVIEAGAGHAEIYSKLEAMTADYESGHTLQSGDPLNESDRSFTFGEDASADKRALSIIERALSKNTRDYQLQWRAARALYYVGDNAGKSEKAALFERGIDAGRTAVELQPNAVEGHFWLAANYGGYSEMKGAFKALQTVGKIRSEMEIVLRLNDKYHFGGAYLALGEMDRQLPRIIGGNNKRAIARLEQGLRIAPQNLEMKLALAQAYREEGLDQEAQRLLQEILTARINPARAGAERGIQQKARKLQGK